MNGTRPPALAIHLMEEAGTEPAVIGDLIETYSQGRDQNWFWRQAIAASAPSPLNALRWALALPVAWWISLRLSGSVASSLVGPDGLEWFGPGSTALPPAMFVFTAALIALGSAVVPNRKTLVARTLFGLVILTMLMMIVMPPAIGRSFDWTPRIIGGAGLLGGLLSYGLIQSVARRRARSLQSEPPVLERR
jgi:hypothetical protein